MPYLAPATAACRCLRSHMMSFHGCARFHYFQHFAGYCLYSTNSQFISDYSPAIFDQTYHEATSGPYRPSKRADFGLVLESMIMMNLNSYGLMNSASDDFVDHPVIIGYSISNYYWLVDCDYHQSIISAGHNSACYHSFAAFVGSPGIAIGLDDNSYFDFDADFGYFHDSCFYCGNIGYFGFLCCFDNIACLGNFDIDFDAHLNSNCGSCCQNYSFILRLGPYSNSNCSYYFDHIVHDSCQLRGSNLDSCAHHYYFSLRDSAHPYFTSCSCFHDSIMNQDSWEYYFAYSVCCFHSFHYVFCCFSPPDTNLACFKSFHKLEINFCFLFNFKI